jgi:hypothetical protein
MSIGSFEQPSQESQSDDSGQQNENPEEAEDEQKNTENNIADERLEQTSVDMEKDRYVNGSDTGPEHTLDTARNNLDKATLEKLESQKSDEENSDDKDAGD